MIIRELMSSDFDKGFLETLSNLSDTGGLGTGKAKEILSKISENDLHHIYVMEDDSQIVGCITLLIEQKFIHAGGICGHIEDVATRKGWEGKGIGSKLVHHAVSEAKKFGCYKIVLDCTEANAPFYEKCGFHRHELCMRIDLKR